MEKAIRDAMPQIVHYPDPDCTELKKTLAGYLRIDTDRIILGNGAVELIYLLVKALQPKKVLLPQPTFGEYEIAVVTGGGTVKEYYLPAARDFQPAAGEITAAMSDVDLVILCNPNNPTGTLMPKEEILKILQLAQANHVTVVVDEAFMDFVEGRENYSTVSLLRDFPNLFILYSLTKFFAIPGLRLGAAMGAPGLITKLNMYRDPWNVNLFAQAAGVVSLRDESYIAMSREFVHREKQDLFEKIQRMEGLRPLPPAVNYIFIDLKATGLTAPELTARLGRRGILVRDCSSYKNLEPYYIRVAVRTREENGKLLAALKDVIRSGE